MSCNVNFLIKLPIYLSIYHLVRYKRLSRHQSGNKKHHSTEMLNIFITDTILEAMDKKHLTALLLLDLSKAFDSIEHSILFAKLRSLGISKTSLEWFKIYLSDRLQFVLLISIPKIRISDYHTRSTTRIYSWSNPF
jgi:hypothetical protein